MTINRDDEHFATIKEAIEHPHGKPLKVKLVGPRDKQELYDLPEGKKTKVAK